MSNVEKNIPFENIPESFSADCRFKNKNVLFCFSFFQNFILMLNLKKNNRMTCFLPRDIIFRKKIRKENNQFSSRSFLSDFAQDAHISRCRPES